MMVSDGKILVRLIARPCFTAVLWSRRGLTLGHLSTVSARWLRSVSHARPPDWRISVDLCRTKYSI